MLRVQRYGTLLPDFLWALSPGQADQTADQMYLLRQRRPAGKKRVTSRKRGRPRLVDLGRVRVEGLIQGLI
jgi:hypothetical protein